MIIAAEVLLGFVGLALLLGAWRLWRGPSLADRVVAMDLLVITAVAAVGLLSIIYKLPALIDIAVVLALIAFIATVAFAWYMERTEAS